MWIVCFREKLRPFGRHVEKDLSLDFFLGKIFDGCDLIYEPLKILVPAEGFQIVDQFLDRIGRNFQTDFTKFRLDMLKPDRAFSLALASRGREGTSIGALPSGKDPRQQSCLISRRAMPHQKNIRAEN